MLSSSVLFTSLLWVAGTVTASTLVECPHSHSDGVKVAALNDADVFQGPPANRASLVPDLESYEWALDGYQQNSEARGEPLFLVCRYGAMKATVTIEIPRSATYCKLEDTRQGTLATCGDTNLRTARHSPLDRTPEPQAKKN
jgi:hypothetical protein